jgi:dephospho-CoA kinase
MKIFIIVGMPAAGKSVAQEYALSEGYPYFSTGDIVRAEVKARGLVPGPDTMAAVSDELRGDDGMGVTRVALKTALAQDSEFVFLEGMRSWQEIALIREQAEAVVVAFLAPRPVRRQRTSPAAGPTIPRSLDERKAEINYGGAPPSAWLTPTY